MQLIKWLVCVCVKVIIVVSLAIFTVEVMELAVNCVTVIRNDIYIHFIISLSPGMTQIMFACNYVHRLKKEPVQVTTR